MQEEKRKKIKEFVDQYEKYDVNKKVIKKGRIKLEQLYLLLQKIKNGTEIKNKFLLTKECEMHYNKILSLKKREHRLQSNIDNTVQGEQTQIKYAFITFRYLAHRDFAYGIYINY